MGRDADGDITNHIIMAKIKTEEKPPADGPSSTKKKNLVRYPFFFVGKNCNRKSLEEKFENKTSNRLKRNQKYYKRTPEK